MYKRQAAAVALPACSPAAPSDASDAKSSSKGGETTGAKHTWEVAPEPIADIAETQDFDVVVVGAGLAGINAAEAAARNGAKTVVIERNTTFSVRGVDVGHIGSKYHKSNGFDLDPVSYTHLDVYKRQPKLPPTRARKRERLAPYKSSTRALDLA